jgi:hypothetical protein
LWFAWLGQIDVGETTMRFWNRVSGLAMSDMSSGHAQPSSGLPRDELLRRLALRNEALPPDSKFRVDLSQLVRYDGR